VSVVPAAGVVAGAACKAAAAAATMNIVITTEQVRCSRRGQCAHRAVRDCVVKKTNR
jgi:hypothetical protein